MIVLTTVNCIILCTSLSSYNSLQIERWKVYPDRCVISSIGGVKGAMFGSLLTGDKEFYFKDITSVQFKNLGMTTGYFASRAFSRS